MAADHFCLRWNNYQNNMVSELDILRTEEYLVDVTLCCEGFKFRAHKVILSACSPYFRNVFKENPCEHPVVILKDVHPEDVEALLSFVYQGVVYVSEKKLSSFLQTAELLQIKGLAGAASSFDAATSKFNSSIDGPVKRRKGAPVRIVKQEDSGEEAGGVQLEAEDDGTNEEMDVSKHDEDGSIGEESESENSGDVCGAMYNNFQIKDEFMAVNPLKNESASNLIHQNFESRQHTPLTPNQIQNQSTTPQGQAGIENQGQGSYQISNTPNHGMSDLLSSAADRNGRRPCPQCTKVISNKSNLLKHIRIRHSDAYNPACCVLCKKIFKNKYSLRAHLNIYHKEYISPVPTQQQQTQQQQQLVTPPPSLEVQQQQQPQQTQLQPPQHLAQSPAHPTFPTTPTTGNQQYSIPS